MNIKLIIKILEQVEEFSNSENYNNNADVESFRHFLNQKAYERENPKNITKKNDVEAYDYENEIAKQVILLGRYSKHLIRKSLENHPDLVNEDFTYLYRMMDYDSLTKMQLIEKNAHEKQTGTEIIKRLVKNGLFTEFPDVNDKRSVRISITEKGRKVFRESMKDITIASKIMTGKLTEKEKENLLSYLKKLNIFHHTVYTNYKNENTYKILELI